jgi:DNA-binding Xre family transcriptional regulator
LIRGWQLALGRAPLAEELATAEKYLVMQQQALQENAGETENETIELQALASICQALFSSSWFIYVE